MRWSLPLPFILCLLSDWVPLLRLGGCHSLFSQGRSEAAAEGRSEAAELSERLHHGLEVVDEQHVAPAKVDVMLAADIEVLAGVRVAMASVVNTCADPSRLRLHLAVPVSDAKAFQKAFGAAPGPAGIRMLPGGASLELHLVDESTYAPFFKRYSSTLKDAAAAAEEKKRYQRATNYARFFIDDFLPAKSDRAVWLDADTVVLQDITDIADGLMAESAQGSHPKTVSLAMWSCESTVLDHIVNRSWAVNLGKDEKLHRRGWNVGVMGVNVKLWRTHAFRDRVLEWVNVNGEASLYKGGSQMPIVLAALRHPKEREDPFREMDPRWNCCVDCGCAGECEQMGEVELSSCNIIHWAGSDAKPWSGGASAGKVPGFQRWKQAEAKAQALFSSVPLLLFRAGRPQPRLSPVTRGAISGVTLAEELYPGVPVQRAQMPNT